MARGLGLALKVAAAGIGAGLLMVHGPLLLGLALGQTGDQAERVTDSIFRTERPADQDRFDPEFQKWGRTYFSRLVDWRWFKAQGLAESGLDPGAISPRGARGVMQLLPQTSAQVAARLGVAGSSLDPALNIMLGLAYDRWLWDQWSSPRPSQERLRLTFAAYNAGLGHLLTAQAWAGSSCDRLRWDCLATVLPLVTGLANARQTVGYVARVERLYVSLVRFKF